MEKKKSNDGLARHLNVQEMSATHFLFLMFRVGGRADSWAVVVV